MTDTAWDDLGPVYPGQEGIRAGRVSRSKLRMGQGLILALGAPITWYLVKGRKRKEADWEEWDRDGLLSYMLLGTAAAFGGFGYLLGRREDELAKLNQRLAILATTDEVTKLPNRRFFDGRLEEELAVARRHNQPLVVGIFDVDSLREINNNFGHMVGDRILLGVAKAMQAELREGEMLARVGGDEFALLLVGEEAVEGAVACARLAEAARKVVVRTGRGDARVTLTAGLASTTEMKNPSVRELLRGADNRLLSGKRGGKNQVVASNRDQPRREGGDPESDKDRGK